MGKFLNLIKDSWNRLSLEDVPDSKEYKYEGDLADAIKAQQWQEKLQNNLTSSILNEDREKAKLSMSNHHETKQKEDNEINSASNVIVQANNREIEEQERSE